MTKPQLAALKKLFCANNYRDYVHMTTAYRLSAFGYVEILSGYKTQGGNFPQYRCSLTDCGMQHCMQVFKNISIPVMSRRNHIGEPLDL